MTVTLTGSRRLLNRETSVDAPGWAFSGLETALTRGPLQ